MILAYRADFDAESFHETSGKQSKEIKTIREGHCDIIEGYTDIHDKAFNNETQKV